VEKIDFIGVGTGRSGTTWISNILERHPDILFSSQKSNKELYFFNGTYSRKYEPDLDSHFELGFEWYFKQFPKNKNGKIRGEFCPAYLFDPYSHTRIKQSFPKAKIIIALRNPADRLYSVYWYCKAAVVAKVPDNFEKMADDKEYLNRIRYYPNLKKYYDCFTAKNIHVILQRNILNKPQVEIKKLCQFLEVKNVELPQLARKKINSGVKTRLNFIKKIGYWLFHHDGPWKNLFYNKKLFNIYRRLNTKSFNKPPMKKETRQKLLNFFKEDIIKTQELIDQDLSHWLK
jgi:hypothetical protein